MEQSTHRLCCPFCEALFNWKGLALMRPQPAPCPKCGAKYQVIFGTVRAKRSRWSRDHGCRTFHLRIIGEQGEERLVEWACPAEDIELRAKDRVALLADARSVVWVGNYTVHRGYIMTSPGWIPAEELARQQAEYDKLPWYQKLTKERPH